jgi:hypothetical protein
MPFSWMVLWGGMTFLGCCVMWASPHGGPHGTFCMSPLAYLIIRAVWTGLQGVLVCAGSYILWCTRGEHAAAHSLLGVGVGGAYREPLSPLSPTIDGFVPVN